MHSHMLWRTAATVATTGTLCLITACGGGGQQQTGRSPAIQQQPSETQTTSSQMGQMGSYGSYTPPAATATTAPQGTPSDMSGMNSGTPGATPGTTNVTSGTPGTTGAQGAQGTSGTMGAGSEMTNLTDEQIVAISLAASSGEVQQGTLAKERAQSASVKKFAERMITDHGQASRDEQRLVAKNKITPMQNAMSQRLASDSKQLVDTLKGEKGAQFDKDYIDAQIREHRELLDMLDNHLIPQTKNPDLKNELQSLRTKVQTHLSDAEDIQRNMTVKP